ncbi:16S rRNA (cytosine(967)-C(5))-methyltransferase RsmB [Thermobrachium celere]|uniref:16S rRNA (cytosine(967)-C(5))-methyltransferase n=1 Tax=Thermobrachium celere DSM 8682 TaxID=941824 RepID=R7RP99_9CLOT|nr:16S rRNA (cytosine(967)-C(5))-methyltransferase RsmB [Thermobrachium celere]GFR35064.1 ribosomal RNA small subunit methyltransferase B [Thermobrachium celere]CDF57889.1 Ribosomal RNA small subunit methyltransferase B [Thermobrachium celere DSM 8682]
MKDIARYIAVKTLCDIEEGAYSNIKLNHYFKKYDMKPLDRAFAAEIVYGTLRHLIRIDYFINKFSTIKTNKMSKWVLNCLRIAVYQIFYMDKVPEYAAINESVEIVKNKERKASGFVNGILRNILRNKQQFYDINVKDKVKKLSIEYSHPEWMVNMFIKDFGEDFTKDLLAANNTVPKLTIRVNTLKTTKYELKEILQNKGIKVSDGVVEEALILEDFANIEKSDEFNKGLFTIQDESSMLPSKVLDAKQGMKVLDLCSAPGGKTTHIAQLMNNNGEIIAFDIHEHKLKLINDNAKRLGINIINAKLKDAQIYMEEYKEYADRVLVDAPCSGLGLLRKKPEIKYNIDKGDIEQLARIQKNILNNAAKYVKKDGYIVYSTCTLTVEENEEVIKEFLRNNDNFIIEDINNYLPEKLKTNLPYLKIYPNVHKMDGFFIAKLKRIR